jgi:type IV pilus assembly protein PilQ
MLKKPRISIIIGLLNIVIISIGLPATLFFLGNKTITFAAEDLAVAPTSISTPDLLNPAPQLATINKETSGSICLDFKDADIQNVLRILSLKGNVNIVAAADVAGNITVKLSNVSWEKALDVILKTYDYGYEKQGNIITVTTMQRLTSQKEAEQKLYNIQPLITEVFTLNYLDAEDVKETLKPQLSPRGTITVLKAVSEAGWEFAGGAKGESLKKSEREEKPKAARSKTIIVSDIPAYIEKIKKVIELMDVAPQQVLIEARIMEVDENVLKDIGFDWGTGSTGAESSTISATSLAQNTANETTSAIGGHILGGQVTPAVFSPQATSLTAANTGLKILYQQLRGNQFEVILHALEEDVNTNTLSAPRIMTLNNQEATILVGQNEPILKADISSDTNSTTTTQTLDYYQMIGIQLSVVPQISGNDSINMLIHPSVSSYTTTRSATTTSGSSTVTTAYPIIDIREAETQVLMRDGETVVIGGLLKDVNKKNLFSVPLLGDIPILGELFKRRTTTKVKIDLLIFITARIVKPAAVRTEDRDQTIESYQLEQEIIRERLQKPGHKKKKSKKR